MIVTLCTGSACVTDEATSACPISWWATMSRSFSERTRLFFSSPATTRSIASSKSAISTAFFSLRAASSAASLTMFARSAPAKPGVRAAITPRSITGASTTARACNLRIASRPLRSGLSTTTWRSKRPGRRSAWSSTSGRFVAATRMTPFDSSKGVILVAATNRPEVLDQALLRPGRFDRQVVVDKPDLRGREAILRLHARAVVLAPGVDLGVIAARTPGFAGADLANIVNEAALLAARKEKNAVEMSDFEEAIDRVVAGLEKKSRVLSEKERDIVAHHEMGHALVATSVAHADPVHKVTIIPRGIAALGMTYQLPTEERFLMTRSELEDRIAVLLGGRVAEELVYGEVSTGAHNDLERATEVARLMVTKYGMSERVGLATYGERTSLFLKGAGIGGEREYSEATARTIDEEVRAILERTHDRVRGMLTTKKAVLISAAQALKRTETLEGERLRRALAGESMMEGTR